MINELEFKKVISQYCKLDAEDISNDMRFREDLEFSSLDFMSFLGELEDTFDLELEEEGATQIFTVGQALDFLNNLED